MTWAEVLAVFNFTAWLLPILTRSFIAWKYDNNNRIDLSSEEFGKISGAISKLNLRGKRLKISDRAKKP